MTRVRPREHSALRGWAYGCVLCLLVRPLGLAAEETPGQLVQELFTSEMVYSQQQGELQVRYLQFSGEDSRPRFSVEYGLTDWFQIEAGGEFDQGDDAEREVGLQWSLLDLGGKGLHFAAGFENESVGSDYFAEQVVYGVVAREYQGPLGQGYAFAEIGAHAGHDDLEHGSGVWDASAGFVLSLSRHLRWTQELAWTHIDETGNEDSALYWTPGITWILPGGTELAAAVSTPLRGGRTVFSLSLVRDFDGWLGRSK